MIQLPPRLDQFVLLVPLDPSVLSRRLVQWCLLGQSFPLVQLVRCFQLFRSCLLDQSGRFGRCAQLVRLAPSRPSALLVLSDLYYLLDPCFPLGLCPRLVRLGQLNPCGQLVLDLLDPCYLLVL